MFCATILHLCGIPDIIFEIPMLYPYLNIFTPAKMARKSWIARNAKGNGGSAYYKHQWQSARWLEKVLFKAFDLAGNNVHHRLHRDEVVLPRQEAKRKMVD